MFSRRRNLVSFCFVPFRVAVRTFFYLYSLLAECMSFTMGFESNRIESDMVFVQYGQRLLSSGRDQGRISSDAGKSSGEFYSTVVITKYNTIQHNTTRKDAVRVHRTSGEIKSVTYCSTYACMYVCMSDRRNTGRLASHHIASHRIAPDAICNSQDCCWCRLKDASSSYRTEICTCVDGWLAGWLDFCWRFPVSTLFACYRGVPSRIE